MPRCVCVSLTHFTRLVVLLESLRFSCFDFTVPPVSCSAFEWTPSIATVPAPPTGNGTPRDTVCPGSKEHFGKMRVVGVVAERAYLK